MGGRNGVASCFRELIRAALVRPVQRLRRLVQTETDRSVNLNALRSQVEARDGDHYNNVIVSIAAESGETPNFQRFCESVAQRFFSLAPGNSSLRVCDRLCGAVFSMPKLPSQMSLRYCAACHVQGPRISGTFFL